MIGTILKVIGGSVLLIMVVGVGLNGIKGTPSVELIGKNLAQKKSLEKQADGFGKCDRSLKAGSGFVGNVTLTYLPFGSPVSEEQKVKDAEKKYLDKIKAQCEPVVKAYRDEFVAYKQTTTEIANTEMSLFDKLIGRGSIPPEDTFSQYDPSFVSMRTGAITDLVFTADDVRAFYKSELGY